MVKTIPLYPTPPFNFNFSMEQVEGWTLSFFNIWTGELYFQSLTLDTFSTVFGLTWNGSVDTPQLALDVPDSLSDAQVDLVKKAVSRQFSLHLDLEDMKNKINDDRLMQLLNTRNGYHPVIFPTPWECICYSIISSQISGRLTDKIIEKLMHNYGETIHWQNMDFLLFPRAEQLATAKLDDLRAIQLSMRKAEYLTGLANQIGSGEVNLDAWAEFEPDLISERLQTIRGIGPFIANFTAVFGYGKLRARSPFEAGFQKILAKVYDIDDLTPDRFESIISQWGDYREVALFYMWYAYDQLRKKK